MARYGPDFAQEIVMALKPHILETRLREKRQRQYLAAPALGEKFPAIEEVVVELRFTDPEGRVSPSPHKRIFVGDMQAFFEFPCPLRECTGGGYSLSDTLIEALSRRRLESSGTLSCDGKRAREKGAGTCCGLELHYRATARKK
jgi:hypothetical protein